MKNKYKIGDVVAWTTYPYKGLHDLCRVMEYNSATVVVCYFRNSNRDIKNFRVHMSRYFENNTNLAYGLFLKKEFDNE